MLPKQPQVLLVRSAWLQGNIAVNGSLHCVVLGVDARVVHVQDEDLHLGNTGGRGSGETSKEGSQEGESPDSKQQTVGMGLAMQAKGCGTFAPAEP